MAINQKRSDFLSYIVALLLVILTIVVTLVRFNSDSELYDNSIIDLAEGWTTEDGKTISIDELPKGKVTITYDTSELYLIDKALCLKCSDTIIDIYIPSTGADQLPGGQSEGKQAKGGESEGSQTAGAQAASASQESDESESRRSRSINDTGKNMDPVGGITYHYAPEETPVIGKAYGNFVQVIPLPPASDSIIVTLTPIFKGDSPHILFASIEDPSRFITFVYRKGLPEFIACLIMVLFGVLMLLLETTGGSGFTGEPMGFVSLGAFSFLIGLWSMNDTYILQLLTEKPAVVNFICNLCIIFIPYPLVSFTATAVKKRRTPLLPIVAVLTAVNLAATIILSALGITDPHYMLMFSRINIIIAIAANVYLQIQAILSRSIEKSFMLTIIIGMTAAMAGFSIDFLRYWFTNGNGIQHDAGTYSRSGAIIFIILVGIYILRENSRIIAEYGKTEMMKKMAYTDALTELPNRAAYYAKESAVQKSGQRCTIAMFDINCLKTVNDEYGHAEGDRHIKAAASIIHDTLSKLGTCYRIGGDEFVAILDTDDTQVIEEALNEMSQAQEAYNLAEKPPVPLHIAYGYTLYSPKDMTLEIAENMADNKMYDMKRIMKATR